MPHHLKSIAIKTIQAVLRGYPEEASVVLQNVVCRALRKPLIDRQVLEAKRGNLCRRDLRHKQHAKRDANPEAQSIACAGNVRVEASVIDR